MATRSKHEEQKRLLEAQESLRKEEYERRQKVKSLKRDIRHLKYGHISRGIVNTGKTLGSGFKSVGTQLKPLGKQIVNYGQYLASPPKSSSPQPKGKIRTIYIKKGGHYVRRHVRVKKEYKPSEHKQHSGYEGSSLLKQSDFWGW